MAFPPLTSRLTGTAVPLSALKSGASAGIGEFADLPLLGVWCRDAGLNLIQLLPVNDTGFEPSPYSALSAFALHPVYLRLDDLPGFAAIEAGTRALAQAQRDQGRVDHAGVWGAKLALLKALYATVDFPAAQAEAWLADHPWGRAYAVFWALRERYARAGWQSWPEHQTVDGAAVLALWKSLGDEARFPVWLQSHAEAQFLTAVAELENQGVALKGDIPILLNEDSADVWAHPEYFDLTQRAGAPPDGMNPEGQSWGFPTYRWDALARDGYQWWKDRLTYASRFYQVYRIDHVLGFFRIWAVPQHNHNAELGTYLPAPQIPLAELRGLGYDDGRLVWLSEPHVYGAELRDALGPDVPLALDRVFAQVGTEDLYRFRPDVAGEKALTALPVAEASKGALVHWYRNRTLLRQSDGSFVAAARYYATRGFESLNDDERRALERVVHSATVRVEAQWEEQGRRLLSFMKDTTSMLVCAEDLGSIPDCVPRVLGERGILGLKICRWARDWNAPGQPYFRVADYPELSVCTPSVHDTSTLRQWWEEEGDHSGFLASLGLDASADGPYTTERARVVLTALMSAQSRVCVVALQDWFALDEALRTADPAAERVNTPGTVGGSNWAWRMKPSLEDLLARPPFTAVVRGIAQRSRK